MARTTSTSFSRSNLSPGQLLQSLQVQLLITHASPQDRPLRGEAARLDWRLGGILSQAIKAGAVCLNPGHFNWIALTRAHQPVGVLLIGSFQYGSDTTLWQRIASFCQSTQIQRVAWSERDFPEVQMDSALPLFKGVQVCLSP